MREEGCVSVMKNITSMGSEMGSKLIALSCNTNQITIIINRSKRRVGRPRVSTNRSEDRLKYRKTYIELI